MAIDPELKELVADLKALVAAAKQAQASTAGIGRGGRGAVVRGGAGGSMTGLVQDESPNAFRFRKVVADGRDVWQAAQGIQEMYTNSTFGKNNQDKFYQGGMKAVEGVIGILPPALQLPLRLVHRAFSEVVEQQQDTKKAYDELRKTQTALSDLGGLSSTTEGMARKIYNKAVEESKLFGIIPNPTTAFKEYFYGIDAEQMQAATEVIQQEAQAVKDLEDKFYAQARLGNIGAAENIAGQMVAKSKESGIGKDRINAIGSAGDAFYRFDLAKTNARLWSAMESPRAGPRSEVD